MKYIKKYENSGRVIEFDLIDFVQYVGDLHSAIDSINNTNGKITLFVNNSKYPGVEYIKKSSIPSIFSEYIENLEDEKSIKIEGAEFSYGYLRRVESRVMITEPTTVDEKLELFLSAKKYNL